MPEYIEAALLGRREATEDEARHAVQADRIQQANTTSEHIDALEANSKALDGLCRAAVGTELYQRGLHQWYRQWRRRPRG